MITISMQHLRAAAMKPVFPFVAAAVAALAFVAAPALAQTSMAQSSAVPGGITLVPGTVVLPHVGGATVTGRVPLAGTVGSAGVPNYNPGVLREENSGALNPGALYPVVPRTGLAPVFGNQTSLPQALAPEASPLATSSCPSGVSAAGGGC